MQSFFNLSLQALFSDRKFHEQNFEILLYMKKHQREKRFNCEKCSKGFHDERTYKVHLLKHNLIDPQPFKCDLCPRQYALKRCVKDHIMFAHHETGKFKCAVCDKILPTQIALERHQTTHVKTKNFSCKQCGLKFARFIYLKSHVRLVHGKENY